MNIKKLLGPRIILRIKDEDQTETEDGVFIPQSAVNDIKMYDVGTIVDLGTGKMVGGNDIEFSVSIGDKVLVNVFATKAELRRVEIDSVKYTDFLMNDGEISAILE